MNKIITNTVYGGLTLHRHYDDLTVAYGTIDSQCGSLAQWDDWLRKITVGLEYYNFGCTHKMLSKTTIHVYCPLQKSVDGKLVDVVPFPYYNNTVDAYVYPREYDRSEMFIKYFNAVPGANTYKWEGALSHEFGHVHHNWVRCFQGNFSAEFSRFWQKQISINGSLFNKDLSPWKKSGGGVEYPNEQYANAFRCYLGLPSTRGVSGPGTTDPVVEGFKDPKTNQAWCYQMKLLPETAAFVDAHGIKDGTLSWPWGDSGGWQFQAGDGWWYAHTFNETNLAQWFKYTNTGWVRVYPTYNRT